MHPEWLHTQGAIGKYGIKCAANGAGADQPGTARVHADHLVFITPAGHQLFNVALLQRIIKSCFGVVCIAGVSGKYFGFSHGMGRFSR